MNAQQLEAVLRKALPQCHTPEVWAPTLLDAWNDHGITEPEEQAIFLAQCAQESGQLNRLEENLNYRPERLLAVWPSRFKDIATAEKYANNPVELANYVYGGRLGNSPTEGWKYRGRGIIQITGRDNYALYGSELKIPLLTMPDIAGAPYAAAQIAARYWIRNGLVSLPNDEEGFIAATRRVNGGLTGYDRRHDYWLALKGAMGLP